MAEMEPIRKRTRAVPSPGAARDDISTGSSPALNPATGDDYEVGYKKPPNHTRFKPGRSGNPKGRPKGARNLKTELAEELQELVLIREHGTRRTVSKQRAVIKSLVAKAAQGDPRAANLIFNLVLRLFGQEEDGEHVDLQDADLAILKVFEDRVQQRTRKRKEKQDE